MSGSIGLSEALGRQHAVSALLVLMDSGHPLRATELTQRISGFPGSGIAVARHLAKAGLVDVKEEAGVAGKPAYWLGLTARGRAVARHLSAAAKAFEKSAHA